MSYIPDYRKETDKLNDVDKALVAGFRVAVADMMSFFDNLDDEDLYTFEKEVVEKLKENLKEWIEEIEKVCSLFDNADYLPEETELVDANSI